jgi:hypothetical protein
VTLLSIFVLFNFLHSAFDSSSEEILCSLCCIMMVVHTRFRILLYFPAHHVVANQYAFMDQLMVINSFARVYLWFNRVYLSASFHSSIDCTFWRHLPTLGWVLRSWCKYGTKSFWCGTFSSRTVHYQAMETTWFSNLSILFIVVARHLAHAGAERGEPNKI